MHPLESHLLSYLNSPFFETRLNKIIDDDERGDLNRRAE